MQVELSPASIRAILELVGPRVSETGEQGTPLEQAERELDLALVECELSQPTLWQVSYRHRGTAYRILVEADSADAAKEQTAANVFAVDRVTAVTRWAAESAVSAR